MKLLKYLIYIWISVSIHYSSKKCEKNLFLTDNVLEIDIEKWIELENEFITNKKLETPKQDDFNMEYFLVLQTYYNLLKYVSVVSL